MADEFLKPHRAKCDAVLAVVAQTHQLPSEAITRAGKTRRLMAAKREAVTLAVEFLSPPLSAETIGGWLNLSRAAIYRQLADVKARVAQDPEYSARLDHLRTRIGEALQLNTEDKSNGQ